jgi:diguanylate cyclase (GGDEF)-like protein
VLLGTDFNKDVGIDVLNKKAITDYAKRAIATGGKKVYIAVLDLDHFKTINDTFGHLFGDEVLATTAEIIKEAVGNRGIVGRIGGDEMMIVIDRIEEHTELRNLLRTIRTNVEWAYKGKRDDVNVTCSIGVAAYPEHGDNYEKVFQIADKMLYLAKEKGRNRYIIYIPEIHDPKNATIRNEQNESKITALQNDKVGIMQRLIENFLIKKIVTNEMIFGEIGYGYGLDEILMLYENMSVALQWTETEICSDIRKISFFQPDEAFIEHFDKNKVFVMNGLFNLEGKSPQIASVLQEKGIESAVFYKITKMDQCVGYVMFARRSRRSMWSEYEIMVLSVIGKILELSVMDR